MRYFGLVFWFLVNTTTVFSQQKFITHKISKGETISFIAEKYKVSQKVILDLNPKASGILKLHSTLKIPNKEYKLEIVKKQVTQKKEGIKQIEYEVLPKETLFSIAKKYHITVNEIKQNNPSIEKRSLQIGDKIKLVLADNFEWNEKSTQISNSENVTKVNETENSISEFSNNVSETTKSDETETQCVTDNTPKAKIVLHKVLPKETKFGIAKKYGITLAELNRLNASTHKKLKVGEVLKIKDEEANEVVTIQSDTIATIESETKEETNGQLFGDYSIANELIAKASDNLGTRYRFGGTTKAGFDCSGFICSTFNSLDIKLPRSSIEQANIGIKISPLEAQKGDLIFFKTRGRGRISHVGMVVEVVNDEIKFIHSSTSSGVIISSTKEAYYHNKFAQVNRVLK